MTTMYPVSLTAQWMAAARALESERPDAQYVDPFARDLAGDHGFELLHKYENGGLVPFISIRTRFLDDGIRALVADDADGGAGIRQIVLLAAGLDMRAFRLDWPEGAVVYEVDHVGLIEHKRAQLERLGLTPKVERRTVSANLTTDWVPELVAAGFDPDRPTLWIAEGLSFFLTPEQATAFLGTLAHASAPGSRLELDILGEGNLRNPFSRTFLGRDAQRRPGLAVRHRRAGGVPGRGRLEGARAARTGPARGRAGPLAVRGAAAGPARREPALAGAGRGGGGSMSAATLERIESFLPERSVRIEELGERLGLRRAELGVYRKFYGLDTLRFDPDLALMDLLRPAAERAWRRCRRAAACAM